MPDQVLQAFPFLKEIPEKSRVELLGQSIRKSLEHKQVLVRDGKECAYLPFVLRGTLRVYKSSDTGRELTFYRIERGESCILTATCILSGGKFPAVAEAEGATDVLLVPSKLIMRLVESSPPWRKFVFGQFSKRLEAALTLVEEVAFRHMDARIAAFLLREAAAGAEPDGGSGAGSEPDGRPVRRTHGGIADEIGTSREVVSRIMKDFEAAGLIAATRGNVRILNRAELEKRAADSPQV